MTIEFDDNGDPIEEDASGLRKQLSRLGNQNKTLEEKLAQYETRDLLTSKGYDLVEASDLVGVKEADREERAAQIQTQRLEQQRTLLKKALGRTIEDEDDLEALVNETLGKAATSSATAEQVGRARELTNLDSTPVPLVDTRNLHGTDAITAALELKHNPKR